ncbi:MAG TPA: ABC transporter permease, partial [Anaerolineales bacterium]|nr:ABC transporter permease [Anaerolineales bacterium]
MSPLNTLLTAVRGISSNVLRTALTTLGIIIGVASVIATLALGNGARASVEANFRFLGSDQILIDQDLEMKNGDMHAAGKTLTYEDGLGIPGAASLVDRVEMRVSGQAKLRYGRETEDLAFQGTDAGALLSVIAEGQVQPVGWPSDKSLTPDAFIRQGRFFTDAEVLGGDSVCVLGYQTALDLFQGDDPIGQTVWVNRKPCQVIGVITELEAVNVQDRINTRPNEGIFMPISFAIQNLFDQEPWVTVIAHVKDESKMEEAKAQIAGYLRQRHGITQDAGGKYADDFHMTTKQDVLGAQLQSAATFSILLTALAIVSLVVGGIGVMNVMLVSVSERTREIGVRMAVGARGRDVVAQFLLEAVLLSAGGGLLGIAFGVLTVPFAASLNQGAALLDPSSIPLAFGVSLATGLIFGLYPALRASQLDPIEA